MDLKKELNLFNNLLPSLSTSKLISLPVELSLLSKFTLFFKFSSFILFNWALFELERITLKLFSGHCLSLKKSETFIKVFFSLNNFWNKLFIYFFFFF